MFARRREAPLGGGTFRKCPQGGRKGKEFCGENLEGGGDWEATN